MRDEIDGDGLAEDSGSLPPSLLPYEQWIEQAYREVMIKALTFAQGDGLPGEHHFYITFRTTARGVKIPTRLLAQYPQEMTIVLQHQFWDLKVDPANALMSVGLSFGSVPSTLVIPFAAISGFADPQVRLVLRFTVPDADGAGLPERSEPALPMALVPAPMPEPARAGPGAKAPDIKAPDIQTPDIQTPAAEAPAGQATEPDPTPQVVSLDAFRRRGPVPN